MLNAFKIFKVTFDNVRCFALPLPNICNALPLTLLKNSSFFSNALLSNTVYVYRQQKGLGSNPSGGRGSFFREFFVFFKFYLYSSMHTHRIANSLVFSGVYVSLFR